MPIWVIPVLIFAAIGLMASGPGGMVMGSIVGLVVLGGLRLIGAIFRGESIGGKHQ
jgi:hypothetical protein